MEFQNCPHCDAPLKAQQVCCRNCGSDLETGWRDAGDIEYASVMLPEDEPIIDDSVDAKRMALSRGKRIGLLLLGLLILTGLPMTMGWGIDPWSVLAAWLVLGLLLGRMQSS